MMTKANWSDIQGAFMQAFPAVLSVIIALAALDGNFYRVANREYTTPHVQPYTDEDNKNLPLDSRELFLLTDVGWSLLSFVVFYVVEAKPSDAVVQIASACNAYGIQLLIIHGLKVGVGALRPNGEKGSFPSEHTGSAAAWCFYTLEWVLSKETRNKTMYVMQVLASLCLMSYPWFVAGMRILGSYHYAVDVTAGLVIGMLSARMAFAYQRNYKPYNGSRAAGPPFRREGTAVTAEGVRLMW